MNQTAIGMCKNIQGVKLAYVQSDEISLLLTDFEEVNTSAWFDANIQKMVSISASLATIHFNKNLMELVYSSENKTQEESVSKFLNKNKEPHIALFDSRVFTIPEAFEVENYFIWRQQDATRNSVQMVAQSLYSHKELHGKNSSDLQEMIFQKGINWNDYPVRCKRGAVIAKEFYQKGEAIRSYWVVQDPPVFTQERSYLRELIPVKENWKKEVDKLKQPM
jgi:tRNA(His) 5'-end guanylyltransferase